MADQKNNKQLKKIPAAAKPKEKLNHVHKRHTSVTQLSKEEQPDDDKSGYKVAAKKSMKDILNTDKDDKSLNTYKKALMGTGKKAKCMFSSCLYCVYGRISLYYCVLCMCCVCRCVAGLLTWHVSVRCCPIVHLSHLQFRMILEKLL